MLMHAAQQISLRAGVDKHSVNWEGYRLARVPCPAGAARAIMAERERAAKVADSRIVEGDAEYLAGWRRAAEIIGNDIRKGDKP